MEANKDKVRQVLLNLVSNAIQFTPEGGRVTVEAAPEAEWIGICVADTGVGIAEEDQERIFEAFQQLNGDGGPPRGGTGLGLALTRRLIELHGGRVRVESRPGQGSRFHVELPATQRIEPLVEAGQPPDGPLVLVVEDPAGAAALLVGTLRRDGYRTEVVRDHRLAVAEAVRLRPFAITLDILLPGPDGWDVLPRVEVVGGDAAHPGRGRLGRGRTVARPRPRRRQLPGEAARPRCPALRDRATPDHGRSAPR